MVTPFLNKAVLAVLSGLVVLLIGAIGYAKIASLQRDAALVELGQARSALEETKADRDRQVGALSRQIEATTAALSRSADIMRTVHAAPPSSSCSASPRIGAYLGELRRSQGARTENRPARGADQMPAGAAAAVAPGR